MFSAVAEQAATGPSLLLPLCVVTLASLLIGVAVLYRGAYIDATSDAKMWERRARAAGWMPSISETQARKLMADLFPNGKFAQPKPCPLPPFSYPLDLIIGTPSCPVVLDRGGELDDRAVASTLDDLVRSCGGRLT